MSKEIFDLLSDEVKQRQAGKHAILLYHSTTSSFKAQVILETRISLYYCLKFFVSLDRGTRGLGFGVTTSYISLYSVANQKNVTSLAFSVTVPLLKMATLRVSIWRHCVIWHL
jgi:hypothetical protein